jgi:hypothetical protein
MELGCDAPPEVPAHVGDPKRHRAEEAELGSGGADLETPPYGGTPVSQWSHCSFVVVDPPPMAYYPPSGLCCSAGGWVGTLVVAP